MQAAATVVVMVIVLSVVLITQALLSPTTLSSSTVVTNANSGTSSMLLSEKNVLLPQTSTKTKSPFILEAYNGCFKWYHEQQHIIWWLIYVIGSTPILKKCP